MRSLKFLKTVPWVIGLSLAMTPAVFALGPMLESRFFPVVRDARVVNVHETPGGVQLFASFRKVRQCEFIALVWYDGPVRFSVEFEPDAQDAPRTRPTGDQFAGPWLVRGLGAITGSHAFTYHRCHPLWVTISTFYQSDPDQGDDQ